MRPQLSTILSLGVLLLSACELTAVDEDGEWIADTGEEWETDQVAVVDEMDELDDLDDLALLAMPNYQMPFHCGQTWRGNTFRSHKPQRAIDLNHDDGDLGRDVLAAAKGTVKVVADTGADSYGKWIEIGHGGGHRTRYAHLSKRVVSVGQHVRKGQKIGEVGESGGASGPHLHYEQRHDGAAVRVRFNGNAVFYYGERSYRSHNCN